jgi:hypothetical protein
MNTGAFMVKNCRSQDNTFMTCHYIALIKSTISAGQVIDLKHQISRTACALGLKVSNLRRWA